MYAIAIIRYRRPFEEVLPYLDAHRQYLAGLKEQGKLIVSGPVVPRTGGVLLLRIPDGIVHAELDRIRNGDPYVQAGVAQYELLPWEPGIGRESLDSL